MRHYVFLPNSDQFNAIGLEPADRNIIEVRNLDTSTLGTWTPVIVHGFEDNPGEEGDFPSLTD